MPNYNPTFDLTTQAPANTFGQLLQSDSVSNIYSGTGYQIILTSSLANTASLAMNANTSAIANGIPIFIPTHLGQVYVVGHIGGDSTIYQSNVAVDNIGNIYGNLIGNADTSTTASYASTSSYSTNITNYVTQSNVTSSTYSISSSWASSSTSASYSSISSIATNVYNSNTASILGINGVNIGSTGSINITSNIFSPDGSNVNISAFGNSGANINLTAGILGNGGQFNLYADGGVMTLSSSNKVGPILNWANGNLNINTPVIASNFTGSLFGTASWANKAISASYALNGGFSLTTGSTYPITSSWASSSISSSYSTFGLTSLSSSWSSSSISSSYSKSGSYVVTSSYAVTSSYSSTIPQSNLTGTSSLYSQAFITTGSYISTVTGNYILTQNENGKLVVVNVNAGGLVTITVPSTLNQGFGCSLLQYGTQQLSVIGSGVNILNRSMLSSSAGQYSIISLLQIDSTDYILQGDIG